MQPLPSPAVENLRNETYRVLQRNWNVEDGFNRRIMTIYTKRLARLDKGLKRCGKSRTETKELTKPKKHLYKCPLRKRRT
jgi:hypothetical protein